MMRRFIINVVLFFAIVTVIDICFGYIGDYMQANAKGGDSKVLNDLALKDKHDILVMGSSRAHHHYDTPFLSDTLGLDVYNAGYDGNGVVLAYGLLEIILERYEPKLILYDVEPAFDIDVYEPDQNHKRYISNLKPYYRHQGVSDVIKDVSIEEWYKVHSGLLRYNSALLGLLLSNIKTLPNNQIKGYEPLYGKMCYDTDEKNNPSSVKIDYFKLNYVEKMIRLLKEKNIPLAVVASPKFELVSSEQLKPIKTICEETGTLFLDYYNDQYFLSHKEWFKDRMHLNDEGAKQFSRVIAQDIQAIVNY